MDQILAWLTENWEIIVQVFAAILIVFGGTPGVVWLVQQLKESMNLSGFPAQVLAAAVSLVLAIIYLVASGEILAIDLRPDNIVYLTTAVYGLATALYHQIRREQLREKTGISVQDTNLPQ